MMLLNTEMKRQKDHLARFLLMARDYGRQHGFSGTYLIEPKPMEPTKHQHDYDAETTIGFIKQYGLHNDFKRNIEANHATLAGHIFQYEFQCAADAGLFGSIDANRRDYQNGWDTDQFSVNLYEVMEAMLVIAQAGGLCKGGVNFDAKVRRNSTDIADLFIAHITATDVFARALLVADAILRESDYLKLRRERYASFDGGNRKRFEEGKLTLDNLRAIAIASGEPPVISGKQEFSEQSTMFS